MVTLLNREMLLSAKKYFEDELEAGIKDMPIDVHIAFIDMCLALEKAQGIELKQPAAQEINEALE